MRAVARAIEAAGVEYLVTGSVASSLQGEPRSTHDIDLVVDLPQPAVASLLAAFPPPAYHLDEVAVREAVRGRHMFNLLEVRTGDKVDFWPLKEEPFDRSRFARKCREDAGGFPVWVSSPEDTILAKLKWAMRSGGSEKQFRDALRVYEVQHGKLDLGYLERWVRVLEVGALWERLRKDAQPL